MSVLGVMMSRLLKFTSALLVSQWFCMASHADFLGNNTTGDYGIGSGTQPDPGVYLNFFYLDYSADTLRDQDGNSYGVDPARQGDLDVNAWGAGLIFVSERKLFGGNYGFQFWPSVSNNKLEIPILGQEQKTDMGFGDLYIQPINLGWKVPQADFTAGLGLYVPTGSYDVEADDNNGSGMWGFELFAGTTVYLDKAKTWSLAATAFYEIHSEKKDSDIRVGDILTIEGGLGKSFMDGLMTVGVAYFAQWKLTDDDLGSEVSGRLPRFRTFGVGPEVTVPIASKRKLYGLLNFRYLFETGARSTVEGEGFMITYTMPLPSVALQ